MLEICTHGTQIVCTSIWRILAISYAAADFMLRDKSLYYIVLVVLFLFSRTLVRFGLCQAFALLCSRDSSIWDIYSHGKLRTTENQRICDKKHWEITFPAICIPIIIESDLNANNMKSLNFHFSL